MKKKIKMLLKSIFLKLKYRRHINAKNYLSIVAIIKNESNYIAEWIEYHLLVGVTKFFIYDNESEDNLKEVLAPYIREGIVEYKYFPGKLKQLAAYKDVLKKARKETYWLAVIDCDEFIVPISTKTVSDFLKDFEQFPALEINWVMYGSSGKKEKEDGLVIERFKDHSNFEFASNKCVKTILNPRLTRTIIVHDSEYIFNEKSVNADKEKNTIRFLERPGVFDKIIINHYFTKSYAEYIYRRQKTGRAAANEKRTIEEFYIHDRNEIKNDTIIDKYIPQIKENLSKRGVKCQYEDFL